jgi:hypothetical protein
MAGYGNFVGPGATTPGGFGLSSIGAYAGPAATLALAAFVASKLASGTKGSKQIEERRLARLAQSGVDTSKIPLYDESIDFKNGGTGKDLLGRAALYEMFGGNADPAKLEAFGNAAIKRGLVRNRMGTVDIGPDVYAPGHMRPGSEEFNSFRIAKAREAGELGRLARETGLDGGDDFIKGAYSPDAVAGGFLSTLRGLGKESNQSGGLGSLLKLKGQRNEELYNVYQQALNGGSAAPASPLTDALTSGKMPPMSDMMGGGTNYPANVPGQFNDLVGHGLGGIVGPNINIDPGMFRDPNQLSTGVDLNKVPGLAQALQSGAISRA